MRFLGGQPLQYHPQAFTDHENCEVIGTHFYDQRGEVESIEGTQKPQKHYWDLDSLSDKFGEYTEADRYYDPDTQQPQEREIHEQKTQAQKI